MSSRAVKTDRRKLMRQARDPDQAWFWTEEWQAGEREADEDIRAGRVSVFESTAAARPRCTRHQPA